MNIPSLLEQRRAALSGMGEHIRSGVTLHRSLSKDEQSCLDLCRVCRATCYAAMSYTYSLPYGGVSDEIYDALYECYVCCDLYITILSRESVITPEAAELCAAGCRSCVSACAGTEDAILQACVTVCGQASAACDAMAATGEMEEGRAARVQGDEVRVCRFERRDSENGHITGYPIVFNELSQDLGGFRERILPTAVEFDTDVRADFNHNPDYILGRMAAGTLGLTIDGRGVFMDADPPDAQWARDLKVSMDRKDIDQGSFAFRVLPGGQQISVDDSGQQIRTLSRILVRKVSVVSDPAYTKTSLEVRSNRSQIAPIGQSTVGQATPPALKSGVDIDHLRRLQEQAERENQ